MPMQYIIQRTSTKELEVVERPIRKRLNKYTVIIYNQGYYDVIDVLTGLFIVHDRTIKKATEKYDNPSIQKIVFEARNEKKYFDSIQRFNKLVGIAERRKEEYERKQMDRKSIDESDFKEKI